MNNPDQTTLLARVARRASQRPDYLGWVFGLYSRAEGATEQDFCTRLGISTLDFQRLHLCLRPREQSFAVGVAQITAKFELDAGELARIIRHVEAMEAMKQESGECELEDVGLLLAARARGERKKNRQKVDHHGKRKKP